MKKNNFILSLIIITTSSFVTLYLINYILFAFKKDDLFLINSNKDILCRSFDKKIKSAGQSIYHDSGFRNLAYTTSINNFEQIWFDTVCKLNIYRKHGKLKIEIEKNETYKNNSFNYRGKEWEKRKDDRVKNIFLLGGSTAFSFLNSENNTIDIYLEELLNKNQRDVIYKVYNAALPAAFSNDEYIILKDDVIEYDPSIIILLTGFNDSGQIKSNYRYKLFGDSFLNKIITKLLNKLGLYQIKEIFEHYYEKEGDNIEVFKKSTSEINKFCYFKEIRCLFAMQPNISNEKFILSETEERIKYLWENHKKDRGNRIKIDDEIFNQWFLDKNNKFEYLDLRNLGSLGLFSGKIKINEKKIFRDNKKRKIIKIYSKNNLFKEYKINFNEMNIFEENCNNFIYYLDENRDFNSSCKINNYDNLRKIFTKDNIKKGYSNIIYSKENILDIYFNINEFSDYIKLKIKYENFADRNDSHIKYSFSYDGFSYSDLINLSISESKEFFELKHKLNKNLKEKKIFIKLFFEMSHYKGLSSIEKIITGKFHETNIYDNFLIKNLGKEDIYVMQRHKDAPNEFFIDAAHLTNESNYLLAKEISNKILNP